MRAFVRSCRSLTYRGENKDAVIGPKNKPKTGLAQNGLDQRESREPDQGANAW